MSYEELGKDRNLLVSGSDFTVKISDGMDKTGRGGGNIGSDSSGHHQIIGCEFRSGRASYGGNL